MLYVILAARNLVKNRRRSLATLAAIAVGYLAISLFSGYIAQVYKGIRWGSIRGEGLGHLTIAKSGFFKEGTLHPERYLFSQRELEDLQALLGKEASVDFTSPQLSASGLISNGTLSTIFIAEGEPPATSNRFLGPGASRPPLDESKPHAGIVSRGLADMLGTGPGGVLVTLGSTLSGQTNALDLDVLAVWDTRMAATNDKSLRLPLEYVQKLLDTQGASRVIVMLKGEADADAARAYLLPRLKGAGFDIEILTWYERSSFYRQVKKLFDLIFAFLTTIVSVVVLMSIVNTLSMSVMERVREIGTLRALGLQRGGIMGLFAVEGGMLGLAGSVMGGALALSASAAINAADLRYLPPSSATPVPLQIALLPGTMSISLVSIAAVSVLAACWPARRAARVDIVDALGHV